MQFVIGTVIDFEKYGFNTVNFRKNVGRTKTLMHLEDVKVLIPNVETNEEFEIYTRPSVEFSELLASSEWSNQEKQI